MILYVIYCIHKLLIILHRIHILPHRVDMPSALWYAKLFLSIGVPMLIIGFTLFGATLYMRRRILRRRELKIEQRRQQMIELERSNVFVSQITLKNQKMYTSLDMDIPGYLRKAPVYFEGHGTFGTPKNVRIQIAKTKIIENRMKLKQLSDEQVKYNQLISDNDINTHSIKDGNIIYTSQVMNDYPELYTHLVKVHALQNTIHYYRKELGKYVYLDFGHETSKYGEMIDTSMTKLIGNSRDLKLNWESKMLLSQATPVYDAYVLRHKGKLNTVTGKYETPTDAEYQQFLDDDSVRLRTDKLLNEKELFNAELNFETFEMKQLNALENLKN